jgi:hypothetical protein
MAQQERAMVGEIFLGWFVGTLLSAALKRGAQLTSPSDSEQILAEAMTDLRRRLPTGWRCDQLTKAVEEHLKAQTARRGESRLALRAQLRPLRQLTFDHPDGSREPASDLIVRLGLDFDELPDLVAAAFDEAVRAVAVRQADLPGKVMLADLARLTATAAQELRAGLENTLERPPPTMVGRDDELRELLAIADKGNTLLVTAVHGMGGVGKTALARAFADIVSEHFRDGRYEIDLYGFTPGQEPRRAEDVLADLLRRAGYPAASIPSSLAGKRELWRGWLSNRSVLLLLDNAKSADPGRTTAAGIRAGVLRVGD